MQLNKTTRKSQKLITLPQILILGSATTIAAVPYSDKTWLTSLFLVVALITALVAILLVMGNHYRTLTRQINTNRRIMATSTRSFVQTPTVRPLPHARRVG